MQQPFLFKKSGIVFIGKDKNNSVKSFCKMGCGEEKLFSKSFLPRKIFFKQSFSADLPLLPEPDRSQL